MNTPLYSQHKILAAQTTENTFEELFQKLAKTVQADHTFNSVPEVVQSLREIVKKLPPISDAIKEMIRETLAKNQVVRLIVSDSTILQQNWMSSYPERPTKSAGAHLVLFIFPENYTGTIHNHRCDSISYRVHIKNGKTCIETTHDTLGNTVTRVSREISPITENKKETTCHAIVIENNLQAQSILSQDAIQLFNHLEILVQTPSQAPSVLLHAYAIPQQHPNLTVLNQDSGQWVPFKPL